RWCYVIKADQFADLRARYGGTVDAGNEPEAPAAPSFSGSNPVTSGDNPNKHWRVTAVTGFGAKEQHGCASWVTGRARAARPSERDVSWRRYGNPATINYDVTGLGPGGFGQPESGSTSVPAIPPAGGGERRED